MDNNSVSIDQKGISTFKVAATYIGTVVGAGFTSGQEMLQFFAVFGIRALTAMIAGAGALINQQFGLSPLWGNVLMAVFTSGNRSYGY